VRGERAGEPVEGEVEFAEPRARDHTGDAAGERGERAADVVEGHGRRGDAAGEVAGVGGPRGEEPPMAHVHIYTTTHRHSCDSLQRARNWAAKAC
jgi:hypothetical protein